MGVYKGRRKINAEDGMFMTGEKINECIKTLKIKNTEGSSMMSYQLLTLSPYM